MPPQKSDQGRTGKSREDSSGIEVTSQNTVTIDWPLLQQLTEKAKKTSWEAVMGHQQRYRDPSISPAKLHTGGHPVIMSLLDPNTLITARFNAKQLVPASVLVGDENPNSRPIGTLLHGDLATATFIVLPVHTTEPYEHWSLVIYHKPTMRAVYFDSIQDSVRERQVCCNLAYLLHKSSIARVQTWRRGENSTQRSGWGCGFYVIESARAFMNEEGLLNFWASSIYPHNEQNRRSRQHLLKNLAIWARLRLGAAQGEDVAALGQAMSETSVSSKASSDSVQEISPQEALANRPLYRSSSQSHLQTTRPRGMLVNAIAGPSRTITTIASSGSGGSDRERDKSSEINRNLEYMIIIQRLAKTDPTFQPNHNERKNLRRILWRNGDNKWAGSLSVLFNCNIDIEDFERYNQADLPRLVEFAAYAKAHGLLGHDRIIKNPYTLDQYLRPNDNIGQVISRLRYQS
ncbi:hypothetical protein CHU98_g11490 [Xylaria longipes]|nr:hypothetical protein CHU98_g11490 [Xylaria longipes]